MDFDIQVKMYIYQVIARTTRTPNASQAAVELGASLEDIRASFARLHQKRLLVPEPGDPERIRMAPPFSGIETPFPVRVGTKVFYANCAWDALGVPAALHKDALIEAADAHSGEPITLQVQEGKPLPEPCAIHFAVPARHWWDDIVYT